MKANKAVRIVKKIRTAPGQWQFVSLQRVGQRYIWDPRPGQYFLEWWEATRRRRESAGSSPSEALEAQRRKIHELVGQMVVGKSVSPPVEDFSGFTPILEAVESWLQHVEVHSPDKPKTLARYRAVMDHFQRLLGRKQWVEAIQRVDIESYKAARIAEKPRSQSTRRVKPSTVNFEVAVLRTFFNFQIRECEVQMANPCEHFKPLRDAVGEANRRPPVYSQDELDRLFDSSGTEDSAAFTTLLLSGLREQELCTLTWDDVVLQPGQESLVVRWKPGFTPKDYEEREVPIPGEPI